MQNFNLSVALKGAAMNTPAEVGALLIELGEALHAAGEQPWGTITTPPMRDVNGNTVGRWEVTSDKPIMTTKELFEAAHKLTAVTPDTIEEALEQFWGNGVADEQTGSVDEDGHLYRVNRWVAATNSDGMTNVYEFGSVEEAERYMDAD